MSVQLAGKQIGKRGFGLMGFTWRAKPIPTEDAIAVLKEALNSGANFWNAGEFYGTPEYNSCHLLNAYFTKYPEDASKVVISIKGAADVKTIHPTGDEKGVRRSVDQCLKILDGKCKIDIFECARVDPKVPIEETLGYLTKLKEEGKIGGIGLSEVRAETIKRAVKVAKIESVEVEFSLFSTNPLENGIAAACAENNIPMVAYSPLGRGFLTGEWRKFEDLPEDSMLRHYPRFQPENFGQNLKLVEEVESVAGKKKVKSGQVALAWVEAQSKKNGNPVIIPIPGTTTKSRLAENMQDVHLTGDDLSAIDDALAKITIAGDRYPAGPNTLSDG